jgi:nucleotide-binding universal stress UspA family protein
MPVLVAVDDAGSAEDALFWAAAEAAARDCPLRVVHVLEPRLAVDPSAIPLLLEYSSTARSAAERRLGRAAALATAIDPELAVTTELVAGRAVPVLRDRAHQAQLLVVGTRRRSALRRLYAESVSRSLVARAGCPVVVLGRQDPAEGSLACVVLGVDRDLSCPAAIEFAFRAATQRAIPLVIVHAGRRRQLTEALRTAVIQRVVAEWHPAFPRVRVIAKVRRGDPAGTLLAESAGAAMLVVGSRGHRRGHSLGSIAGAVIDSARCPVAVVRDDAVAGEHRTAGGERWSHGRAP